MNEFWAPVTVLPSQTGGYGVQLIRLCLEYLIVNRNFIYYSFASSTP